MNINSKGKQIKIKASHSQESCILEQLLDSNPIVTSNNQKYNLFPSCETEESFSYVRKSQENDEKISKKSILEGILKFDQSLLFQHTMQLYESKTTLSIHENAQNMMNNCDFSFNAKFSPYFTQQKMDSRQQVKKYRSFLLYKLEQIQRNNIDLSRQLIQIKKELIRFHHQKHFIFEDIKAKLCKKVGLCFSQLILENRKLKNMIQNGIEDQKRSKQRQNYLSCQQQQVNQRILLLNRSILEKQKEIEQLKLQNQALIRQNEQLFYKTSAGSSEMDYSQENHSIINNKLPIFSRQLVSNNYALNLSYNQAQQLNDFRVILSNLMKSSIIKPQLRFQIQQISISICKKLLDNTYQQQNNKQTHNNSQQNIIQNHDYFNNLSFKIQYSLLIIYTVENFNKSPINNYFNNEYSKKLFTPQALLTELTSIWLTKERKTNNKIIEKAFDNTKLICSPSSSSIKILNSPSTSMSEIQQFDLCGDSLSLSKSRSKISLMHDKIQQIKKKISGK